MTHFKPQMFDALIEEIFAVFEDGRSSWSVPSDLPEIIHIKQLTALGKLLAEFFYHELVNRHSADRLLPALDGLSKLEKKLRSIVVRATKAAKVHERNKALADKTKIAVEVRRIKHAWGGKVNAPKASLGLANFTKDVGVALREAVEILDAYLDTQWGHDVAWNLQPEPLGVVVPVLGLVTLAGGLPDDQRLSDTERVIAAIGANLGKSRPIKSAQTDIASEYRQQLCSWRKRLSELQSAIMCCAS